MITEEELEFAIKKRMISVEREVDRKMSFEIKDGIHVKETNDLVNTLKNKAIITDSELLLKLSKNDFAYNNLAEELNIQKEISDISLSCMKKILKNQPMNDEIIRNLTLIVGNPKIKKELDNARKKIADKFSSKLKKFNEIRQKRIDERWKDELSQIEHAINEAYALVVQSQQMQNERIEILKTLESKTKERRKIEEELNVIFNQASSEANDEIELQKVELHSALLEETQQLEEKNDRLENELISLSEKAEEIVKTKIMAEQQKVISLQKQGKIIPEFAWESKAA